MVNKFTYCCLLSLAPFFAYAQAIATTNTFIACVQDYYGSSSMLVNGRLYNPTHPLALGSPYFFEDWGTGAIYINGVKYAGQTIKYDLYQDLLVLKKTLANGTSAQTTFESNKVDSFSLNQHLFVSKHLVDGVKAKNGYLEKIGGNHFEYYHNRTKSFSETISEKAPQGTYINLPPKLYVKTTDNFETIDNKKKLLTFFSTQKNPIKKFLKSKEINFKKATPTQLLQLIKFIDDSL